LEKYLYGQLAGGLLYGTHGSEAEVRRAISSSTVTVTAARLRFGMNVKGYGVGGGPRRRALDASQTNGMSV